MHSLGASGTGPPLEDRSYWKTGPSFSPPSSRSQSSAPPAWSIPAFPANLPNPPCPPRKPLPQVPVLDQSTPGPPSCPLLCPRWPCARRPVEGARPSVFPLRPEYSRARWATQHGGGWAWEAPRAGGPIVWNKVVPSNHLWSFPTTPTSPGGRAPRAAGSPLAQAEVPAASLQPEAPGAPGSGGTASGGKAGSEGSGEIPEWTAAAAGGVGVGSATPGVE